ncbi:MAG: hypothetical protein M1826_003610 [Phylliscum demangeonii]|nr:MAG: hypothetical protein M1826_003610 [Phylliscum demangeonii]
MALLHARAQVVGSAPPPPGVTPNFVDPESHGSRIYPWMGIGLALSTAFMAMRVYTKWRIVGLFGIDDVLIVASWVSVPARAWARGCAKLLTPSGMPVQAFIVVFSGLQATAPAHGFGVHLWDLPLSSLSPGYLRLLLILCILYLPAMMFTKFAILIFFRRLSPQKVFRMAIYVTAFIVFGSYLSLGLALFFACHPIAMNWDITITHGSCINRAAVYLATAGANIATDFAILLLPIPMLWHLQIPKRQKYGLALVFGAGSLDCIISIIRLRTLQPLLTTADPTWLVVEPSIWITIELHLSLICACLIVLKPFLRRHMPALIGEHSTHKRTTRLYGAMSGHQPHSTVRKSMSGGVGVGAGPDDARRSSGTAIAIPIPSLDGKEDKANHAFHFSTLTSEVSVPQQPHQSKRSWPSIGPTRFSLRDPKVAPMDEESAIAAFPTATAQGVPAPPSTTQAQAQAHAGAGAADAQPSTWLGPRAPIREEPALITDGGSSSAGSRRPVPRTTEVAVAVAAAAAAIPSTGLAPEDGILRTIDIVVR